MRPISTLPIVTSVRSGDSPCRELLSGWQPILYGIQHDRQSSHGHCVFDRHVPTADASSAASSAASFADASASRKNGRPPGGCETGRGPQGGPGKPWGSDFHDGGNHVQLRRLPMHRLHRKLRRFLLRHSLRRDMPPADPSVSDLLPQRRLSTELLGAGRSTVLVV